MGFFGGNTNSLPQPDQNSAGVPPAQISTNEQARPVPLFYGTRRMGVTFLSQAFDQHADEVKDHSGGKFGSDRVTGYNYYSSFAALVAHGPVDFIREIWFDNQKVWSSDPPLARDDDNPISAPIQINGYGSWTFYWGTEGQTIDDPPDHKHGLASLATGVVVSPNVAEDHPGYVGLCYFVARDQFLGFQRTNIQNIEVVVGRFPKTFFGVPAPRPSVVTAEYNSWLPDGTERIDHSYTDGSPAGADANPVAILVDMLVNTRYGLSLRDVSDTDTALDRAALSALATRFKTTESFGLSPFIDRQQAFSETLTQLLEHVDGWLVADAAGRLTMGLARQQETDELPEISPDALTAL
ncbi:MAG TPA: hypothetical protein VHH73_16165, partial [Verrucomicrobiae bacterium]|nr:hypothetical protein [Verrucomicrobiae bacterium]